MTYAIDPRIVVVGFGHLLPGGDEDSFGSQLAGGVDASVEIPEERFLVSRATLRHWREAGLEAPRSTRGYVVDLPGYSHFVELVDGEANLTESQYSRLDRSARMALVAAARAWGRSQMARLDRGRVATVLANIALPTDTTNQINRRVLLRPSRGFESTAPTLDAAGIWSTAWPAAVVSSAFGLGGGYCAIDAACAASLYSLSRGVDLLRRGEVDAVLVGGVSGADRLYTQLGFSALQALSRQGRCAPFDHRADGLLVGEGAAVFVLKRASTAIEHGDHILASVCGVGLSNDRSGGLLAPSSEGQGRALRQAYREAGWGPDQLDLIECHGTGTPLGDAVEIESLIRLLGEHLAENGPIVLGAVKGNVGHLLTGAGAAGLASALTSLQNETLPPVANFQRARDPLGVEHGPLRILRQAEDWPEPASRPRRFAVSGFGFGGINAHVALEQWTSATRHAVTVPATPQLDHEAQATAGVAIVGSYARIGNRTLEDLEREMLFGSGGASVDDRSAGGASDLVIEELQVAPDEFRIPPREMAAALAQQVGGLIAAKGALVDAGVLAPSSRRQQHWLEDGERTGIYVATDLDAGATDYSLRWMSTESSGQPDEEDEPSAARGVARRFEVCGPLDADTTLGSLGGIVASRVAREFGVGGPAHVVAAADLGGLHALSMAVAALEERRIDRALVLGVELGADPRLIAARGTRRPLGDPLVPAEQQATRPAAADGMACLILERSCETAPGSRRAKVRASVLGVGLQGAGTVSREDRQMLADLAGAIGQASRSVGTASRKASDWVMLHGIGGERERAIERRAMERAPLDSPPRACAPPAVGDAGCVGPLLGVALTARMLTRGVEPGRDSGATPLTGSSPTRAGVNALGALGGAGHVILEEPLADYGGDDGIVLLEDSDRVSEAGLLLARASSRDELDRQLIALAEMQLERPSMPISELARRWWRESSTKGSGDGPGWRAALVAHSSDQLQTQIGRLRGRLRAGTDGEGRRGVPLSGNRALGRVAEVPAGEAGVAFVFPGSGNLDDASAARLLATFPSVLRRERMTDLHFEEMLVPDVAFARREGTVQEQILSQVTLGRLLRELVRRFGVRECAAIGYSLGETAALFATGVWRERRIMLRRLQESALFTRELANECSAAREVWHWPGDAAFEWRAGVVALGADELRQRMERFQRSESGAATHAASSVSSGIPLALLIENTRSECVIGGEARTVERFCRREDVLLHPLDGISTVHCVAAEPVVEQYRAFHTLECQPNEVDLYSAAWAQRYEPTAERCAQSLTEQAVRGFSFPAVVDAARRDGIDVFLEIGPGNSCTRMICSILAEEERASERRSPVAVSLCTSAADPTLGLFDCLAALWVSGAPFDVEAAIGSEPSDRPLTSLARGEESRSLIAVRSRRDQIRQLWRAAMGADDLGEHAGSSAARALPSRSEQGDSREIDAAAVQPAESRQPARRLGRDQCLEFARGRVEPVFGPEFAEVDGFPTRVRLPDEPLMLVDRVLEIEGEAKSLGAGRIVTEHDVGERDWYLDNGVMPVSVAVEAGQADLMLSGFLGIDFETRGLQMYRLLDAVVTFSGGLPRDGEVVRYDIEIERFFRQGDNWLFRFRFDATVNGRLVLQMREGCAGFFSEQDLAAGAGIVRGALAEKVLEGVRNGYEDLLVWDRPEGLSKRQVRALRDGRLVEAFGQAFSSYESSSTPGGWALLPSGRLELIDRVEELDPRGGRFGLGSVYAEGDIDPEAWFLTCHFVDDQVMPGTLMYECCLHALRVFLLRSGWLAPREESRWEPVPGVASRLRCRGQVLASTRVAGYRVEIKEIGYRPEPYAIADATLLADGKEIVEINDLSLRLTGTHRARLEALAGNARAGMSCEAEDEQPEAVPQLRPALYDRARIEAFASGRPSEAFGDAYRPFDSERRIARLPRDPFQFLDSICEVTGEPFRLSAGSACTAQWRVPSDHWTYEANRQDELPFAVLLEASLQPCGWLAAYCGSALTSDVDLSFRNLGGEAKLLRRLPRACDVLTTEVELVRTASSGGMIIQHYRFATASGRVGALYEGTTYFGFFPEQALANQVGLQERELSKLPVGSPPIDRLPTEAPFPDASWRMIDRIEALDPRGGKHDQGFVCGEIEVDPEAWFFSAHFFQDPVWPGSLGLEAFQQLLRLWVVEYAAAQTSELRFATAVRDVAHSWTYRGQVTPRDEVVRVEASIKELAYDGTTGHVLADGLLSVDGRIIYEIEGLGFEFERGDAA